MRADNAAFAQYNTAASKRPRVVIRVSFDTANTDFLYLTSHDDCELPDGAVAAGLVIPNVVRSISGQTQKINPDQANSTIGGFSFSLVDKSATVTTYQRTKLSAGFGLRHKQVVVYVGYVGMVWADYIQALTYIIDEVSYRNGEYKFKCSDIQRAVRQQIFDIDVTYLTKTVSATATHIPCLTTVLTNFKAVAHDASYTDHSSQTVSYIKIEDEIICHSGLFLHGTDGVSFQVVQRGALNSKAVEHVMDSGAASDRKLKIEEHIFIEGPAPKIIYALLTGELYGQSAQLPAKWHLGINTAYVAIADFIALGPDYWDTTTNSGRHVRFEGIKKTDGKKFIETELLLWLGAFMPVYANGALGLRRLAPVLSNSGYIVKLDRSNIVDYSDLVHDFGAVINQINIQWNHVFLKDDYTKTSYLIDADSYAKHGEAAVKNLKFKGIKTGSHTDADLGSYFDNLRDRYAGPPLRLNITVMPSLNWLEVGDTVRVDLDEIRDFNNTGATKLDRVFEVQQVGLDWFTGDVKLELFASSMKAGTLVKTALTSVLADSFYNSAGTALTSVLTIVGGAVTTSGTLTGGATMAAGIYYYLGDLTINAGVVVTITQNVQLRIRGHLTINGSINGQGQGLAGGVGATLFASGFTYTDQLWPTQTGPIPATNIGNGGAGFLGATKSAGHIKLWPVYAGLSVISYDSAAPIRGKNAAVPFISLVNADTALIGVPTDLRGTSGSGGGCVADFGPLSSTYIRWYIRAGGGNGGNGGAGLNIVSRGMSHGVSGSINLSGANGALGASYNYGGYTFYAGSGGGGAPGGFALFLDGNHTPPELAGDELVQTHGTCLLRGTQLPSSAVYGNYQTENGSYYIGLDGFDMGDSAYTLQYIPEYKPIEEELPPPPPNVTGLAAVNDGLHARVTWAALANIGALKYRVKLGSTWSTATFLADVDGTEYRHLMGTNATYYFMVAAVDQWGQESQTPASTSVAGLPEVSVESNVIGADDYLSSTFFYHNTFESLDGLIYTPAATTLNTSGYIQSSYNTNADVHKVFSSKTFPKLSFSKDWKFKTSFEIGAGTGRYLAASGHANNGLRCLITDYGTTNPAFGILVQWNSSTSKIDIFAHAQTSGTYVTNTLITSINDTALFITVFAIFTSGSSLVVDVSVSGITYTATITTNLPSAVPTWPAVMYWRLATPTGTVTTRIYDWKCVQYD